MKYFTIKELIKSDVALEEGINNTPSKDIEKNLKLLIEKVLDPIREKWGKPIYINSGYRCKELNEAVKGSKTSSHMKGFAADITTNSKSENKKLFEMIKDMELEFDQLIDESNYAWVHIGYKRTGNRNQILHL